MCDYSLHAVASRPAAVADRLITTMFEGTSTKGLADDVTPDVAVCLRAGTEVAFVGPTVEYVRYNNAVSPPELTTYSLPETVARFRKVETETQYTHHDAFEFPSGNVILVHELVTGQGLVVIQLPVDLARPPVTEQSETERAV